MSHLNTDAITFRLPVEVLDKLDKLALMSGLSRGGVLITLINNCFEESDKNPLFNEYVKQCENLARILRDILNNS